AGVAADPAASCHGTRCPHQTGDAGLPADLPAARVPGRGKSMTNLPSARQGSGALRPGRSQPGSNFRLPVLAGRPDVERHAGTTKSPTRIATPGTVTGTSVSEGPARRTDA